MVCGTKECGIVTALVKLGVHNEGLHIDSALYTVTFVNFESAEKKLYFDEVSPRT